MDSINRNPPDLSVGRFNYCTAIWYPTVFEEDPYSSGTAKRFMHRGLRHLKGNIEKALVRLVRTQQLLGDRLTVLVDSALPNADIYKLIERSGLKTKTFQVQTKGYWRPKWFAMQAVDKWPMVWFDFLDAEVCSKFNHFEATESWSASSLDIGILGRHYTWLMAKTLGDQSCNPILGFSCSMVLDWLRRRLQRRSTMTRSP